VLTGVYAMHFFVIELAVPLWIAGHTSAPTWLVAGTMLVNTIAVALFPVRLSRGSETVSKAARRMAVSGFWVFAGFALIALAAGLPAWLAAVLLLSGAATHTVGEMIGSAGSGASRWGWRPRSGRVSTRAWPG
jgi:hypothetical protein